MLLKKSSIIKVYQDSLTMNNTVIIDIYKSYKNNINSIIGRQKNETFYKEFFCKK